MDGPPGPKGPVGEPGPPGVAGPPGPKGVTADVEELELAVGAAKNTVGTIVNISKTITDHQKTIERTIEKQVTVVNASHSEVLKLLVKRKELIIKDARELTEITCTKCNANAKTNDTGLCCEDCGKPEFKVPPSADCSSAGCSHTCLFSNSTCDAVGKPQAPCMFPFKYLGMEHTECISYSPFGLTKRPWCFTDTEANRGAGSKPSEWAFCDCAVAACSCPPGMTLEEDGKTCK